MNLKYYRTRKNLSITQLSAISSVPVRTIEDIEKRGSCNIETARKLAEALNINLYDLASEYHYEGPFSDVDLTVVLNTIVPLIKPEDLRQLLIDMNTYQHGIHMKAMDKAYQIYENYQTDKIDRDYSVSWEKTEEQW